MILAVCVLLSACSDEQIKNSVSASLRTSCDMRDNCKLVEPHQ